MKSMPTINTINVAATHDAPATTHDYIIIGSGIAGLFTALRAAQHGSVLLLTKSALEESNTRYAQGGIAAAVASDDSPLLHEADTLAAGAGLCDAQAVRVLTSEAPARIRDLFAVGVPFDQHDGALALGLEAAHQRRRVLHAGGDATGFHIEQALCRAVRAAGITIHEHTFVTEIMVAHGRAVGIRAMPSTVVVPAPRPTTHYAQHIILASGGAGQLFAYTTNPAVATGDGLALAYRAGAALADLEFYQFHPTALTLPGVPTFLVSEAVRGEGAYLRNAAGVRFMLQHDPRGELAPRDVVARAIAQAMRADGRAYVDLDLHHLDPAMVHRRFPTIAAVCRDNGLDLARDLLPVAPAAHYLMGGVRTNLWGETSVPGLYACGEVACTGVHGANRLASNSLLEGLVWGARIVERTISPQRDAHASDVLQPGWQPDLHLTPTPISTLNASHPLTASMPQIMWQYVGLERDAAGLREAIRLISGHISQPLEGDTVAEREQANLALIGWLMATAALARTESRGGHSRSDHPDTDPRWQRRVVLHTPDLAIAHAPLIEELAFA